MAAALLAVLALPFAWAPGAGDTDPPALTPGPFITQTVVRTVDVPIGAFDAWFAQVSLQDILPGAAMVPAVVGTEPVRGTWGTVGARRRVLLQGGGSALEQIVANDRPGYFAYIVWAMGGAGDRLIRFIRGEFHITPTPDGRTRVEWRYRFRPRTALARPYAAAFARFGVRPFLERGLDAIKAGAERATVR